MPFKWRGRYLCFYCGKPYSVYTEFKKHTIAHGSCSTKDTSLRLVKGNHVEIKIDVSEIFCELCNEPFGSLNEIIDHLNGKHELKYDKSVDIPFQEYRLSELQCQFCEKHFKYFGKLISHINNAHPRNSYVCDDCGEVFNKKNYFLGHWREFHRVGGYPCKDCSENFNTNTKLRKHQNKFHLSQCCLCFSTFETYNLLQKHMQSDHADSGKICKYCLTEYKSRPELNQHLNYCKIRMVKKEKPLELSLVQENNKPTIYLIRENIQCVLNTSTAIPFKFLGKFSCFYCSRKFTEFDDLKEHTVVEHPICDLKSKYMKRCKGQRTVVKIDVSAIACKVCCVPFDSFDGFVDHLVSEHKVRYDKSLPCFEPYRMVKDNIPCPICNDKFRYFGILLRHINSQHSNNNVICDFCGRSFKKKPNLQAHIAYCHSRAECDICGAKFNNQGCLSRHKATYHNAKNYKCSKCEERFRSNYQKAKHMIKMHNVGHKCSYCDKMFTRNSFMKDHIRRTHFKEKNVPCSVCGEKFFDNYLLKMHMVKHEGERKFTCDVCGKAFLRRSNLSSHMDMHKKYGHVQI